jgi:hypothetical protein
MHFNGKATVDITCSALGGPTGWSQLRSDNSAAGMIFGNDFVVEEMVTWVGRHVIHVRKAF